MSNLILTLRDYDRRILTALLERRRPKLDVVMRCLTHLGGWYSVLPAALVLAVWSPEAIGGAGRLALWALVSSHLVVQVLKRSIGRERPRMPGGFVFLVEPEDKFSLPSGHSAAGIALALPIGVAVGGVIGVVIIAIGLSIGVSRVFLGVHYPGDVVVGWMLGAIAVLLGPLVGL